MALMHFTMSYRTKSGGMAPASAHARYMLRVPEASAAAHAEYVIRSASSVAGREDLVATGTGNLPAWAEGDPVKFFTAADTYERANGRVCTQIEAALPRELNTEQHTALVQDFVDRQLGTKHAYVWAIHETTARDGQGNPHMHLAFSERSDPGRAMPASEYFSRAGATKDREWSSRGTTQSTRRAWSDVVNMHLEQAGVTARVDPRSFHDQGVDRAATHRVPVAEVQKAKYHGVETAAWRSAVAQREHNGAQDHARAQQYWEARKVQLGMAPAPSVATHQESRGERPLIGNQKSLIYHEPGQPNYGDVSAKNQVKFYSVAEAEAAGYRRARNDHHGAGSLEAAEAAVKQAQGEVHKAHVGVMLEQHWRRTGQLSPAGQAEIATVKNRAKPSIDHPGEEQTRERGQGRGF
jgi:hypothetical protein